jgi:uncharacterized protein (DUF58 family)
VRPDQFAFRASPVGIALCVLSCAAGAVAGTTINGSGLFAGIALGLYLLFAIRVADQWEKVAVLRFGR